MEPTASKEIHPPTVIIILFIVIFLASVICVENGLLTIMDAIAKNIIETQNWFEIISLLVFEMYVLYEVTEHLIGRFIDIRNWIQKKTEEKSLNSE